MLSFATTTILLLGLTFYCLFDKKKITAHSLGRPSRSDFVQPEFDGITDYTEQGFIMVRYGDLAYDTCKIGFMDLDYNYILQPQFCDIYVYPDAGVILTKQKEDDERNYGLFDFQGNPIIEPVYYWMNHSYEYERIIAEDQDDNFRFFDFKGNDILGRDYREIRYYDGDEEGDEVPGIIVEDFDGSFFKCDLDGNVVIEPVYDYLNEDGVGIIAGKDGKKGIIDASEKVLVDFEYKDIIRTYSRDNVGYLKQFIVVTPDDRVGLVDIEKGTLIEPQAYKKRDSTEYKKYDYEFADKDNILYYCTGENEWVIMSPEAGAFTVECSELEYAGAGIFKARFDYYSGEGPYLIDITGRKIKYADYNRGDVCAAYVDGKTLLAVNTGHISIFYNEKKVRETGKSYERCSVTENGLVYCYRDKETIDVYKYTGEYLGVKKDRIYGDELLALVESDDNPAYSLIDAKGNVLLGPEYKYIETSCDEYAYNKKREPIAAVQDKNGKYGIMDAQGNWIYEPQFKWATVKDGMIQVTLKRGQVIKK